MQLTFILPALDDCAPTLIAAATTDRNRDPLKPAVESASTILRRRTYCA